MQTLYFKLLNLLRMPFHDKVNLLRDKMYLLKGVFYYRHVFGHFGSGSTLFRPVMLCNPRHMHIGENVTIRQGARLEAVIGKGNRTPYLHIGDNVNIEQNVHLVCHSRIIIGNDVSITGNCAIVDVTHPYSDVNDPQTIGKRILDVDSFVEIGDGCFLGFAAVVLPGVRIGKYCVIGAHSVVTRDVPDYSVVAGNPARLLKEYDMTTGLWRQS